MRRCAKRFILCLLLGALINVAVAWTLALTAPPTPTRRGNWDTLTEAQARELWTRHMLDVRAREDGTGSTGSTGSDRSDSLAVADYEFGWPIASFACVQRISVHETGVESKIEGGLQLARTGQDRGVTSGRVLPYRAIWPGFLLNSVLYGGAVLLIVAVPTTIRRRRRAGRGRCVGCGYDLAGTPTGGVCPECGRMR